MNSNSREIDLSIVFYVHMGRLWLCCRHIDGANKPRLNIHKCLYNIDINVHFIFNINWFVCIHIAILQTRHYMRGTRNVCMALSHILYTMHTCYSNQRRSISFVFLREILYICLIQTHLLSDRTQNLPVWRIRDSLLYI